MRIRSNRLRRLQFSLRLFILAMLLAGPLGAYAWSRYVDWCENEARQASAEAEVLKLDRERKFTYRTGPLPFVDATENSQP